MANALVEKVQDYLATHKLLNLATVSQGGAPLVRTLTYASEGTTIYFGTNRASEKVENIAAQPKVAFTVDDPYTEDWSAIQGLQMQGRASIVSDGAEMQKAMGLMVQKYPQVAKMPANQDMVIIKIETTEGYLLDYTKGFGHKDKLTF